MFRISQLVRSELTRQLQERAEPIVEEVTKRAKRNLGEAAKAFEAGLHGEEYVPGQEPRPVLEPERDPNTDPDKYDKLMKLGELRAAGVLTEEEFQAEKAKLLAE